MNEANKLKPILFNTEMVRSILDGRKTQTRRIVKPQPTYPRWNNIGWLGWDDGHGYRMKEPCAVGDVLWVRETWRKDAGRYMYRANYMDNEKFYCNGKEVSIRWSPSIHMPREAARIFLEVKNVRMERLRQIDAEGIRAEGITEFTKDGKLFKYSTQFGDMPTIPWADMPETPEMAFEMLWDSTIKSEERDNYGWDANPWVWVIEFERVKK